VDHKKKLNQIKQPAGQITAEYILLAVVFIVMFQLVSNTLADNEYLNQFQDIPNQVFTNMVENGNWQVDQTDSRNLHPNQHNLHYTPYGRGPSP